MLSVFVATVLLNIRMPIAANGGLDHMGIAMLFVASILFGHKNTMNAWFMAPPNCILSYLLKKTL